MSVFSSALVGGPVNHARDFEGAKTLTELGSRLPFPRGVHAIVADVGLFSVLQGSLLEYYYVYIATHKSREVDCDGLNCVGRPFVFSQVATCSKFQPGGNVKKEYYWLCLCKNTKRGCACHVREWSEKDV